MITLEKLLRVNKDNISAAAATFPKDDLPQLVMWLNEVDDDIRYRAFLLLQARSLAGNDVYCFWDEFTAKFTSPNSYQRSLGLMLIAENVRWDSEHRFDSIVDAYLGFCDDEKPVTVRQCVQSLNKIIAYTPHLNSRITEKLLSIDIMQRKETQRKILLMDILSVLGGINKLHADARIPAYFQHALTGGLLDAKASKQAEALL